MKTELGKAMTLDELEIAMKKFKPNAVFLAHSESSTALKQPLIGIGDIVRKYDIYFYLIMMKKQSLISLIFIFIYLTNV